MRPICAPLVFIRSPREDDAIFSLDKSNFSMEFPCDAGFWDCDGRFEDFMFGCIEKRVGGLIQYSDTRGFCCVGYYLDGELGPWEI